MCDIFHIRAFVSLGSAVPSLFKGKDTAMAREKILGYAEIFEVEKILGGCGNRGGAAVVSEARDGIILYLSLSFFLIYLIYFTLPSFLL